MAEYKGHFDYDESEGAPDYDAAEDARFFNLLFNGIAPGYDNELEVTQGSGLQVIIDSGGAVSKGYYYVQDEAANGASPKALSIDAAPAGYQRIDRIVVEFDTTTKTNTAKVHKGTDVTVNPEAPALTDTATKWELSLALVLVSAGTISLITDDRTITGARVAGVMPSGTVTQFAGSTAPDGYLICDGSAISRSVYSTLFATIGEMYGNGDGSTTFNLPNLKGKIPVGLNSAESEFDTLGETGGTKTHALSESELPTHSHSVDITTSTYFGTDKYVGAGISTSTQTSGGSGTAPASDGGSISHSHNVSGNTGNTGSGIAHNNLQPYIVMNYIIKC